MPSFPSIPALPRYRLLFICLGNICRSPAAEGVMNHLVKQAGLENTITCDSAGTIDYHSGKPADPRMARAASRRDIPLTSRSRPVTPADFSNFDLLLTMDASNYRDVLAIAPDADARRKVIPMLHFSDTPDAGVPDPYYGGERGFEEVLDLLQNACTNLLETLQKNIEHAS